MPTDTRTNDELSPEVARRVFGMAPCRGVGHKRVPVRCYLDPRGGHLHPVYASDHNASALVVAEMRRQGWHFYMDEKDGQSLVSFWRWQNRSDANALVPFGEEPRGICLAALAALEAQG